MKKIIPVLALSFLSSIASAYDDDVCSVAISHLELGGKKYGPLFDKVVNFLNRKDIPYINYGDYCDNYGGCGADLFSIGTGLQKDDDGFMNIYITKEAAASASGDTYYILGKLKGSITHKECSSSSVPDYWWADGHTWTYSSDSSREGKMVSASTTLNKVGQAVASGYEHKNWQINTYAEKTIIVKLSDFQGNAEAYQTFLNLMSPLYMLNR